MVSLRERNFEESWPSFVIDLDFTGSPIFTWDIFRDHLALYQWKRWA